MSSNANAKLSLGQCVARSAQELRSPYSLTGLAMLTALNVVLHFFTIVPNEFLKIGLTFLAIGTSGYLYGPVAAGAANGVADIIKYLVWPTAGGFFPGFTLNAVVTGFLYGLVLYQKAPTIWRALAAKCAVTGVVNLLLTPLWLSVMYGSAFWALMSVRITKNLILLPIETVMLLAMLKAVQRIKKPHWQPRR